MIVTDNYAVGKKKFHANNIRSVYTASSRLFSKLSLPLVNPHTHRIFKTLL